MSKDFQDKWLSVFIAENDTIFTETYETEHEAEIDADRQGCAILIRAKKVKVPISGFVLGGETFASIEANGAVEINGCLLDVQETIKLCEWLMKNIIEPAKDNIHDD